jgi:hypothetical protein
MRDRFVPPSYHRELSKKLMCLDQSARFDLEAEIARPKRTS